MPYRYYGKLKTTDFFDYALTTKSMSRKKEGLSFANARYGYILEQIDWC